jgi:hypothetical protein
MKCVISKVPARGDGKIGFIGLGIMGKPMAKNLLKAGHEVVCFDIVRECVESVVAAGGKAAPSAKAVAEQCTTIITMLPNSPHVKEAVMGPGGVLEGAKAGTILIDMKFHCPAGLAGDLQGLCGQGREDDRRPGQRRRTQGHRRHAVDHGRRRQGGV